MFYIKLPKIKSRNLLPLLVAKLILVISITGCVGSSKKDIISSSNNRSTVAVIVTLHGLNSPNDPNIASLARKLNIDVKDTKTIILNRYNSTTSSTKTQAEEAYIALKKQMNKQNLTDIPVFLIGYSQGGLVGLELYRINEVKKEFKLSGVITYHSPLEGAPGVNLTPQNIQELKSACMNIMRPSPIFTPLTNMIANLDLDKILNHNIGSAIKGDLTPGSHLLEQTKTTLSTINIPVLALGGKIKPNDILFTLMSFATQGKSSKYFLNMLPANSLKQLEQQLISIIGDTDNDALIPTSSQIGQHIINNNITRRTWLNQPHFYGMTKNSEVYNEIKEFITNCLQNKNNFS